MLYLVVDELDVRFPSMTNSSRHPWNTTGFVTQLENHCGYIVMPDVR